MTEVENVSRHSELLAVLTRDYPNTIVVLDSINPISRYTCLMHVLDFVEKPEYEAITRYGFQRVFAGGDFAHWLIERGLLVEVAVSHAREGDIVIYFADDGRFKHAGVYISDGSVTSKWGVGQLYKHGLSEVPESYGTRVGYFTKLPYDKAFEYFRQFAKERGMLF
jgi:hypothetical protein